MISLNGAIEKQYRLKYNESSDEEIIGYFHEGESEALDYLIHKYKPFVHLKAKPYFLVGADREDVIQEGMIGLYKAIRDFKLDKVGTFKSFAELCIIRQIITAIKSATRQKHIPLNSYVSLYKPIFENDSDRALIDMVTDSLVLGPEEIVINREESNNMEKKLSQVLSPLERKVLPLFLDGKSYKEISEELDRSVKAIDNALTRIKRKVEKYIETNDIINESTCLKS
ncbi:RNA polymerase sporulation sigma factor SigH [Rossellomorea sp. NPDC071047]|uniref:RNA polymerase sporulation sigma factor SigH n=1 Tax=Rossellomorea sp. NPDC071047 TaxID=3390675 RepID=UPI003CFF204E